MSQDRIGEYLQQFAATRQQMMEQLRKTIVGQTGVIEQILAGIFTRGHCLLIGVPGLAKTLLVSSLSEIMELSFKRIQFTPDLMPTDITGTMILDESSGRREFRFVAGPIFANILLADEINRTPPKTQAALLQAMAEREVTVGQETHKLPEPFFVIATQNPIEQEGTYPLPEAQLDRFMFTVRVDYPSLEEEKKILQTTTRSGDKEKLEKILSNKAILNLQKLVLSVPVVSMCWIMWPGWCEPPGLAPRTRPISPPSGLISVPAPGQAKTWSRQGRPSLPWTGAIRCRSTISARPQNLSFATGSA